MQLFFLSKVYPVRKGFFSVEKTKRIRNKTRIFLFQLQNTLYKKQSGWNNNILFEIQRNNMITHCGRNSSIIASQSSFFLSSPMMLSTSNRKGGGVGGGNGGIRTGTGGCSNKTVEKPLRRKWILEKWLIWITLLVTSILLDCKFWPA